MRIDKKAVRNILVLRNDRFGEFILNIPALGALKESFPEAHLTAVVAPYVKGLASRVPFIDETMEWARMRHTIASRISFIARLKKKKIDIAVMLNPDREFNIIAYLAGIPVRAGYDRKWGFLLTHKIKDLKHLGEKHEVDYNLELVSLVGAHTLDKALRISINESDGALLSGLLPAGSGARSVAMHPWTSDPLKQWPAKNFRELAVKLSGLPGVKVIVVGKNERADNDAGIFSGAGEGLLDLTGKTDLIQLAGVLKKCALLISGDSGPVHLASAVGTKALALFRNDMAAKGPRRWGPWGEGHIVVEKGDLGDITVTEVFEKAREALNN